MLQGSLTLKTQVKYNECTTEERAKVGRYADESGPAKATRHFSGGKLPWGLRRSGFWSRDQISKFKIHQIKIMVFWLKSLNLIILTTFLTIHSY